jgi:transaldolase/fructose-6-phosphate aldolase-like protein
MTRLQRLYDEQGQSPWLDNIKRGYLLGNTLASMVGDGIRGVTANPTILAKAIEGSEDYDEQFRSLSAAGRSAVDAYWELVIADIASALALLRPTHDSSGGGDGFVSLEVAPELARDRRRSTASLRSSSAGSTPRSIGVWGRSAAARLTHYGVMPRSPKPSSRTSCAPTVSPGSGGSGWPDSARTPSARSGRRRRPRTPPTGTRCTSTASSARAR